MRIVTASEVHHLCEWRALAEALLKAHRGPRPLVDLSELHATGPRGERQSYLNLPAFQPGVAMGTKIVTVMPMNPDGPTPSPAVQAFYVLFEGGAGTPIAIIDGTALTYRKTAADSALGARLVGPRRPRTLVMVGAGGLAPYLVAAHRAINPMIERVLVWNRRSLRAEALAAAIGAKAVDDLESAVRVADIVSCATASTSPIVQGAWLKKGAHLDLVGSFTPEMRECDDEAVVRARCFVDSRMFGIDPGDLGDPIQRAVIRREKIEADLFDLAAPGYNPQRSPADITLYKNGGGAHLDLFTALYVKKALGL